MIASILEYGPLGLAHFHVSAMTFDHVLAWPLMPVDLEAQPWLRLTVRANILADRCQQLMATMILEPLRR